MRRTMGKLGGWSAIMAGLVLLLGSQANAARIDVRGSSGAPGDQAVVNVVLVTSQGEEVAGTQNDITFNPGVVSVAAVSACVINPEISDRAAGCDDDPNSGPCKQLNRALDPVEGGLTRFRGLVLSLANTTTINDPSAEDEVVLYTCTFEIAEDAELGVSYDLTCSNQGASDPDGGAIETGCSNGQITVAEPPTVTPTASSTVAATNTPTVPTGGTPTSAGPTRTNTRDGGSGGGEDDDGCQVVSPTSGNMLTWLLFAPAAFLLWSRRRSR